MMLVADGCAGRVTMIAHLAAYLGGYTVFRTTPRISSRTETREDRLAQFKVDLITAFKKTGVEVRIVFIYLGSNVFLLFVLF